MSNAYERVVTSQDLKQCAICSRRFVSDRIKAHEIICQKSSIISRKPFQVSLQRLKGTEGEILPTKRNNAQTKSQKSILSTNWRCKHEDFIKTIKAIKKCNDRSEKQSDLPLTTPPNFSECVQCPYCLTELSKLSVEGHIQACITTADKKSKSKRSLIKNSKSKTSQTSDINK